MSIPVCLAADGKAGFVKPEKNMSGDVYVCEERERERERERGQN